MLFGFTPSDCAKLYSSPRKINCIKCCLDIKKNEADLEELRGFMLRNPELLLRITEAILTGANSK